MTSDDRFLVRCDNCGRVDDHPKHHLATPQGVSSSHLDCCADAGCQICIGVLGATKDRGLALVPHLEGV